MNKSEFDDFRDKTNKIDEALGFRPLAENEYHIYCFYCGRPEYYLVGKETYLDCEKCGMALIYDNRVLASFSPSFDLKPFPHWHKKIERKTE